jgi:kinesin family protein C1
MQGSGVGQMRGIIPRAIEQVGEYKTELERDGWQYDMQVSFVEIYNETIRDLLRDEEFDDSKHDIKIGQDGRRFVSGINMVPLEPTDSDAVEDIMRQAAKYRSVGSTSMNAVSSRSHSVFTLHLTALNPLTRQAIRGTLNLCDLAGSERLSRSEATGARAKEAMAINKSLSSLTDVFVAIGKKQSHIPFRNSKLTRLLEPSLSGDGKTLMLVNLSPTELSTQESVCSLRFAAQVNKCELGKAKRSLEEVDEDDAASISSSMSGHASRAASVSAKKGPTMKSPPGRTKSKVGGGRTPASSTRRR